MCLSGVNAIENANGVNGNSILLHLLRRFNGTICNICAKVTASCWHAVRKDDDNFFFAIVLSSVQHLLGNRYAKIHPGGPRWAIGQAVNGPFDCVLAALCIRQSNQLIAIVAKGHNADVVLDLIVEIIGTGIVGNLIHEGFYRLLHSILTALCIIICRFAIKIVRHGAGLVQHQDDVQGSALPWNFDLFPGGIGLHGDGHVSSLLIQHSIFGEHHARIRLRRRQRAHRQQGDDHTQGHDRRQ